jgi:fluoride ion exporter CrcB/FEX
MALGLSIVVTAACFFLSYKVALLLRNIAEEYKHIVAVGFLGLATTAAAFSAMAVRFLAGHAIWTDYVFGLNAWMLLCFMVVYVTNEMKQNNTTGEKSLAGKDAKPPN